jgi:hypothetical protein
MEEFGSKSLKRLQEWGGVQEVARKIKVNLEVGL